MKKDLKNLTFYFLSLSILLLPFSSSALCAAPDPNAPKAMGDYFLGVVNLLYIILFFISVLALPVFLITYYTKRKSNEKLKNLSAYILIVSLNYIFLIINATLIYAIIFSFSNGCGLYSPVSLDRAIIHLLSISILHVISGIPFIIAATVLIKNYKRKKNLKLLSSYLMTVVIIFLSIFFLWLGPSMFF